jgi:hypothetical protein
MRLFRTGQVAVALVVLALAGCGKSTTRADVPPTDAEVYSAFVKYWKDTASGRTTKRDNAYNLVMPVSAQQFSDGVYSDSPYGRQLSVRVSYVFRSNVPLTYTCTAKPGQMVWASPAGSAPEDTFPNTSPGGVTFSCVIPAALNKVPGGWVVHPDRDDAGGYFFRR